MKAPNYLVMYLIISISFDSYFHSVASGSMMCLYSIFGVFGSNINSFVYASSLAAEVKLDYSVNKYFMVLFSGLFMVLLISMSSTNVYLGGSNNFNIEGDMMKELVSMFSGVLYLYVVIYLLIALYNVCWMMKIFEGPLQKFT
uniref:NADH dehydrogenase subunit 6 n=1 Tax=Armadillidium vulgare TaxID=13347 RepID=B0F0Z2_ARMVU|nr:NADH dehydrogenase subunit 6 [Armadillidium vulgare]